jgi:hypothetical protein
MNKVALIIIYNHQYNKNIGVIENVYKNRFSNIYHLVPFYNGDKDNVIPVYENSFYFQGYVSQGFTAYFKKEYEHYIFIGDDLILNPIIDESNYTEHFKLKSNTCFISGFIPLHEMEGKWWSNSITKKNNLVFIGNWWQRISYAYNFNQNVLGLEINNQLPDYDTAKDLFKKFNLEIKPLNFNHIWQPPISIKDFARRILNDKYYFYRYFYWVLTNKKFRLPYPLVASYSDIFVISSDAIKNFCHYCGVFATTKLFVEIGLPTSLVLSAQEIVTEKDLELQGCALWPSIENDTIKKFESKTLDTFLIEFPKGNLYLHPIKLSKIKLEK